jgi:hypothetical protein
MPARGLKTMASYKNPSFQDRVGQAAEAKKKALDQLRLRPLPDEKTVGERKAAEERRQAAKAQKAEAKKAAAQAALDSKAEVTAKAATPEITEADRKAARDARYAARKKRK